MAPSGTGSLINRTDLERKKVVMASAQLRQQRYLAQQALPNQTDRGVRSRGERRLADDYGHREVFLMPEGAAP
jgi:hypothetical protein